VADQAQRILAAVVRFAERRVRHLIVSVNTEIAIRTPIDTGFARSNWLLTMGGFLTAPVGSKAAVAFGARGQSEAAILRDFRAGETQVVYSTNAVPYIQALNHGSSRQAPAGAFVQTGIRQGIRVAAKEVGAEFGS
jgi:hypothetical protein